MKHENGLDDDLRAADSMGPSVSAGRLLTVYTACCGAFLAGVVLLDRFGFQAIPGHATPFYALLRPLHHSWTEMMAVGPLVAFPCLLLRRLLGVRQPLGTAWRVALALSLAAPLPFVLELYLAKTGGNDYSAARASVLAVLILMADAAPIFLAEVGVFLGLMTARRIRVQEGEPSFWLLGLFLVGAMAFLFLFSGAVAEMRGGTQGIAMAYHRLEQEYIADIGKGGSIRGLFAQFVELNPHLSHHARVHPPGPIVLLWMLSFAVGRDPLALSLATMAFATLSVVPLFFWVRELAGPRAGLVACALFAVSPGIVAFTATSADMLFMPFTLMTLCLFDRAVRCSSWGAALGAGVFYALMSLCSFNLLCMGVYFGLAGLWELRARDRRMPIVRTAALMLAAFLATFAIVYLWSGFNIVECFFTDWRYQRVDLATQAARWPAPAWWVLHPLSIFYYAGIPVSVLFFQRVFGPDDSSRPTFAVMALTFLLLCLIVPARGEMERTGLYLYPLLLAPAAHRLAALWKAHDSEAFLAVTLGFLAFQSWLTEYLLQGYW